jgi:hypothetical protein
MWRYRDVAITWFALGLVAGMIVAFASCSVENHDLYVQPSPLGARVGAGQ